jgi:hypothetical protein
MTKMKTTDNIYFRKFEDALAYIRGQQGQLTDPNKAVEVCMGFSLGEFFVYFRVG